MVLDYIHELVLPLHNEERLVVYFGIDIEHVLVELIIHSDQFTHCGLHLCRSLPPLKYLVVPY